MQLLTISLVYLSVLAMGFVLLLPWRRAGSMTLLENLFLSAVLGLGVSSLVVAGLRVLGWPPSPWLFTILGGASALLVLLTSEARHGLGGLRNRLERFRLSPSEKLLLVVVGLQVLLLGVYFYGLPFFPHTPSTDPTFHSRRTAEIVEEGGSPFSGTTYPPGFHSLSALTLVSGNLDPLAAARLTAAVLVVLGVGTIFYVAKKLYDEATGVIASFSYVVLFAVGWLHLADLGTYANQYADLLTLMAVWLLLERRSVRWRVRGPLIAMVGLALILAHSSAVVILSLSWVLLPVVVYLRRKEAREYLYGAFFLSLGAVVAVAVRPDMVLRALESPLGPLRVGGSPTPLTEVLSLALPPLVSVGWLGFYVGDLVLFLGLLALGYAGLRRGFPSVFLMGWFLWILLLSSPFPENAPRFSLLMFLPMCLLFSRLVAQTFHRLKPVRKPYKRITASSRLPQALLAAVLILVALASPLATWYFTSELTVVRGKQLGAYDSMLWLGRGSLTPQPRIITYRLEEYRFLPLYSPELVHLGDVGSLLDLVEDCLELECSYVVVWKLFLSKEDVLATGLFSLVYESGDVAVYRMLDDV